VSAVPSYWARLRRRVGSELFNARRSLGLIGWRRESGPRIDPGASVRSGGSAGLGVPIVLCVWRRPERLATTLASLAAQTHASVNLWIWNNNPELRLFVDETVAGVTDFHVDVVHCTRNIGGFGRFYIAQRVAHAYPHVVFLDDDQVPAPDFVECLVGEFRPKTVRGAWAFRFRGTRSYWDRVAAAPGERVKFCGNGGMICDTQVFLETGVFKCPRRFWFVEDLWLSYYVDHVLGWPLFKSGATIVKEPDDQGQFHSLVATKDIMLRYLVRRGWDPLLPESHVSSRA
jgi:Glycosyl transferase family 2